MMSHVTCIVHVHVHVPPVRTLHVMLHGIPVRLTSTHVDTRRHTSTHTSTHVDTHVDTRRHTRRHNSRSGVKNRTLRWRTYRCYRLTTNESDDDEHSITPPGVPLLNIRTRACHHIPR